MATSMFIRPAPDAPAIRVRPGQHIRLTSDGRSVWRWVEGRHVEHPNFLLTKGMIGRVTEVYRGWERETKRIMVDFPGFGPDPTPLYEGEADFEVLANGKAP